MTMTMRRALLLTLLAVLSLAACSNSSKTSTSDRPGDARMSSFDAALAAFRREVASLYKQSPSALKIIPDSEKVIGIEEAAVPGFVAFYTSIAGNPVRGWANGDGVVVLAKKENFGPIVQAAKLLDASPALSPADVAARIGWAYGTDYKTVLSEVDFDVHTPPPGAGVPALDKQPDGSAVLTFYLLQFGDTGSVTIQRAVVTVAADYQTTVRLEHA